MSGTAFSVQARGLDAWARLAQRVHALSRADTAELLEALGAEGESQTRRRISEEKTSPAGEEWPEWSENYARTRHEGQSLLEGEGHLLDSLQYAVDRGGETVEWGSNLVYAAIHEFGGAEVGKNIPARSYLGLSDENLSDIEAVMDRWGEQQLRSLQ